MKIFIMFMTLVVSFSASATEFKCYASKFPSDINQFNININFIIRKYKIIAAIGKQHFNLPAYMKNVHLFERGSQSIF